MNIDNMIQKVSSLKGEREAYRRDLKQIEADITRLEARTKAIDEARAFIQEVAAQTQRGLEIHLSSLVTTALQAVFDEDIEFVPQIVTRRGRTECDLFFKKDGNLYDPMSSDGGGTIDIASFALRLCFWSLHPTRPVFILDEPFKYVSPDLQEKVSNLIKMLSEKLNVQFIIVSHQTDINVSADKTFVVTKEGKYSTVSAG